MVTRLHLPHVIVVRLHAHKVDGLFLPEAVDSVTIWVLAKPFR